MLMILSPFSHHYPYDKQGFLKRVQGVFPVNNLRYRIVKCIGMVNFRRAQFLENSKKNCLFLGIKVNRCSPFPVLFFFK